MYRLIVHGNTCDQRSTQSTLLTGGDTVKATYEGSRSAKTTAQRLLLPPLLLIGDSCWARGEQYGPPQKESFTDIFRLMV